MPLPLQFGWQGLGVGLDGERERMKKCVKFLLKILQPTAGVQWNGPKLPSQACLEA